MKIDSTAMVTIHPYFKAKPGKLAEVKPVLQAFLAKTKTEQDVLFYDFTVNGDEIFCREGYRGAAGALFHLENVSGPLQDMLKVADLVRIEVHGPAAELEKLKGSLAGVKPIWFTRLAG